VTAAAAAVLPVRKGARRWLEGYLAMLRWEVTGMRLLLPLTAMVQMLSGGGMVIGFGLLYRDMPLRAAEFLSTGAAVITLVLVGLILGPQLIAQQKASGTYDFTWSLPVPRTAATAAWTTLNLFIALPGMAAALLIAVWRYGVALEPSLQLIPAVALTLTSAALLGYALAHAIPRPELTQLASQVLIFWILGFSPIAFPTENLPQWLSSLNEFLPFGSMAEVVRAGLLAQPTADIGRAYLVLGTWTVIAAVVSVLALGRRR
jgi:ABC-2 type transport system permease protein